MPAVDADGKETRDLLDQMEEDGEYLSQPTPTARIPVHNLPKYPVKGTPKDHQLRALAEADLKPGHALWMDPGAGKAQPLIAKICTPQGWVEMGSLKVGDEVIGSNGKPTKVTGIYPQGKRAAYRVTVSGGASTICCDEHLWAFTTHSSPKVKVAPLYRMVKQGIKKASGQAKYILPTVEPVQFEESHLPLDPYALGALIGDGALTCGTISLSVPPHKEPVAQRVAAAMPEGIIIKRDAYEGATPRMLFTCGPRGSKSNALSKILKELELRDVKSPERFVPDIYKYGSVQQRLDLLRGLMDTDGSCYLNRSRFHTMSPRLADDVIEIVRSLGGAARARVGKRDGEITLSIKMTINPFWARSSDWSLAAKQNQPRHLIQSVEYVGEMEMQCISVAAPDRLYVTDDYIVTHNTFTCIAEAGHLFNHNEIDGVIVVAPMGPHEQWVEEQFPLWADYTWQGIHNKMPPSKIKKFFDGSRPACGVLAINYDGLRTKKGRELIDKFIANYPRIYLVIDESQKIKNPRAQRTKEALVLALRAKYRRLLSGTPILKGLEDLWAQYEAVEPGLAWEHQPIALNKGGKGVNTYGYIGYRNHFCRLAPVPGNPRATRIVGYRNEDELRRRVQGHSTRILAEEFMVSETPDFIRVRTPMGDAQSSQYKLMKRHLVAMIDSGAVTAQNALVQMGKLRQIAAGFLYEEDGDEYQWLGDNKITPALDLIEQLTEPVIVWSDFRAVTAQIIDRLVGEGYKDHIYLRGDVDQWKEDPRGILVGNQTSGLGVGMNLQHAAANIYLTNSFSSEARWQSLKRTDRIGQTRQVRYWDFITPDSVEVQTMAALAAKEDISKATIDELRAML